MITKQERAEDFHYDLRQLLKKYGAEMWVEQDRLFATQDTSLIVYMKGSEKLEYTEIDLGRYVGPKTELLDNQIL